MLTVEITGDRQLIAKLSAMPERVRGALYQKCVSLAAMLQQYIIRDKLSGQVLNHRSGDLWRSIHPYAEQSTNEVSGRVASEGVPYAAIHEYGGHIPGRVIEATNGKSLAFMMNGQMRFFKRVNWPGANMPERSFMRSSLKDKEQEIINGMSAAVSEAVK